MFWPVLLPLKITCLVVGLLLAAAVLFAVLSKYSAFKVVAGAFLLCTIGFVPLCIGIQYAVDEFRFGYFEHSSFEEVNDFRIERYLPPKSRDISLFKNFGGNGYRAKYVIEESALEEYADSLWKEWGEHSSISRPKLSAHTSSISKLELPEFTDLGWVLEGDIRIFHSPVEADGGGATYYHERQSGLTFQRTGYW